MDKSDLAALQKRLEDVEKCIATFQELGKRSDEEAQEAKETTKRLLEEKELALAQLREKNTNSSQKTPRSLLKPGTPVDKIIKHFDFFWIESQSIY